MQSKGQKDDRESVWGVTIEVRGEKGGKGQDKRKGGAT